MCFVRRYGFRRNSPAEISCLHESLRIPQQIIYPPPHSNSAWSPVLAATAPTAFDTFSVLRTPNNVIADTRQITHSTAPDQHYRVLLKVVTLAGDVSRDFDIIRQTNTCHLPKCRVRLLRRNRTNLQANPGLLRRALLKLASATSERVANRAQCRCLRLLTRPLSRLPYKLVQRGQSNIPSLRSTAHLGFPISQSEKPRSSCNR